MTSNFSELKNNNEKEVVIRDLQGLLRKSIGNEVTVLDYKTSYLIAKGENYTNLMLQVDMVVQKTRNFSDEKLSLAAKTLASSDFHRERLDYSVLFRKEIFFYEKLMPAYRELEIKAGIEGKGLIDISPKYYGGRLSLNENLAKSADTDAVILMENLQKRGFRIMDRRKGLDFEHAKLPIKLLAHYHALGIALKHRNPEFFAEATEIINKLSHINIGDNISELHNSLIDITCKDSRIAKYKDRVAKAIRSQANFLPMTNNECSEPWIGISHSDFWLNNIMFYEEGNQVKEVKIVDYQVIQIYSPILDLPYFLCSSCQPEVVKNNFDELLDMYYDKFIEIMNKINYDTTLFSKKSFLDELDKVGKHRLFQCLMALKFSTLEKSDEKGESQLEAAFTTDKIDSQFYERAWVCVSKFVEKGWI